jgi:hypothetical protein
MEKVGSERQAKHEDLIRRLREASQSVELELQADRKAVSDIEKEEDNIRFAFGKMNKPFLEMTMETGTRSMAESIEKRKLDISTESTLLPRQLFPRRLAQVKLQTSRHQVTREWRLSDKKPTLGQKS